MGERRRAPLILVFCMACALFNWPLVGLFLEADLFSAFAGLFAVLGLLAAALFLAVGRIPTGEAMDEAADAGQNAPKKQGG